MKERDRDPHTHTHREKDLPSLGEGVSLYIHTHTNKNHTNHTIQHTLTGLRAPLGEHIGKHGIRLLKYHSNHATVLWLSLPQFSHSFKTLCVADDSWGEIRKPTMWLHTMEVLILPQNTITVVFLILCLWGTMFKLRMKQYAIMRNFPKEFVLLFSKISTTLFWNGQHFTYKTSVSASGIIDVNITSFPKTNIKKLNGEILSVLRSSIIGL